MYEPVAVELTVDDDSVPIGTHVNLVFSVTGGAPEVRLELEAEYGPPACRAVIESYTASNMTGNTFEISRAGAHDLELTATDGATPPATKSSALTITGLPPDTLTPNASVNECTLDGAVDMFRETIHIDVFAGQERMGPLYDDAAAYPQEQVEFSDREWDAVNDQYLSTWTSFESEPWGQDANGNVTWVPVRPDHLQLFWFVAGDGTADGSYIHDGKGAGYTLARAQDLETRPAGFPFAAQRQRVRVQYTRGCGVEHEPSDVFYPTLVTTGVVNGGTNNPHFQYRDLGDWIINTADPR